MLDFKAGPDGPCLLEVNPRLWGSAALATAAEAPLFASWVRAALGEAVPLDVSTCRPGYRLDVRMKFLPHCLLAGVRELGRGGWKAFFPGYGGWPAPGHPGGGPPVWRPRPRTTLLAWSAQEELMGKSIVKATSAVAVVMLLSKVLGFLRQSIVANVYGSNTATDVYFVSSEFMINLSGAFTTALTTALVTVYISVALNQDRQAAGKVASRVLSLFLPGGGGRCGAAGSVRTGGGMAAGSGLHRGAKPAAGPLSARLFSVAFLFSAIQSIYAAVQNANDIFIPGKLYGVIYNPVAIFCMLALGERLGLSALVYAYYIANVIQVVFLHLRSRGLYRFTPTLGFRDENVVKVWRLALPVLVSNVLIQLNGVVDKAICSYLGEGMASSYTYANTLEQFVTGTFTATINLILLSRLC